MAKALLAEAAFDDHAVDDLTQAGHSVVFDGERGLLKINQDHNWLLAYRPKHHVSQTWQIGTAAGGLREVAGVYTDRLKFRITPRHHVTALRILLNGASDGNGDIRITTPAGNVAFNFAAVYGANLAQTNTVPCTATLPPTTQLVVVALRLNAGTYVDLRRLMIRDEHLALGGMP